MKYVYPACFYKEEDDRYSVDIPDFGMATFGDDLADALYMAADAIAGRVHLAIRNGESLPAPSPSGIKDVTPDESSGFVSMIYVDLVSILDAPTRRDTLSTAMPTIVTSFPMYLSV
ncbi:MAG: type II toxin-antitoxin system HicB family antitoxin [Synergistaceae bacterium]|nr:type II toxin-antitoxin system HicB family antitoxin [Synergistaceae bacterium]